MSAAQFQHLLAKDPNVSRETFGLFETWYNLLSIWNKRINLVSPAALHDFWLRHALDSWQLMEQLPIDTKTVLDMGAGAGFPGLALAIGLKNNPESQEAKRGPRDRPGISHVTLVEANGKKCNFLRTVIRELALPAEVVQARVENLEPQVFDVITARAFAPLPKLLAYSLPFWGAHSTGLFPKGETWQSEVTAARKTNEFDLTSIGSQTNDQAKILRITNLQRKAEEI